MKPISCSRLPLQCAYDLTKIRYCSAVAGVSALSIDMIDRMPPVVILLDYQSHRFHPHLQNNSLRRDKMKPHHSYLQLFQCTAFHRVLVINYLMAHLFSTLTNNGHHQTVSEKCNLQM